MKLWEKNQVYLLSFINWLFLQKRKLLFWMSFSYVIYVRVKKKDKSLNTKLWIFFFNHFTPSKAIKLLRWNRLLSVNEYRKKEHYKWDRTIKEQELRRQKITIDIAFKFLKIKVDSEVRKCLSYFKVWSLTFSFG